MDYTHPGRAPPPYESTAQEGLNRRKSEGLLTLRRATMAYLSVVLLCWVTLGQPLEQIILSGQRIELPFANVSVSFPGFLIFGPILLFAIWIYIQIFMRHLVTGPLGVVWGEVSVLGGISGRVPFFLAFVIHICLLPVTLALFAVKGRIYQTGGLPWSVVMLSLFAALIGLFHVAQPTVLQWLSEKRGILATIAIAACYLAAMTGAELQWSGRLYNWFQLDFESEKIGKEDAPVRFDGLDLRQASFSDAELYHGARLRNANLKGAILFRVALEGADLRRSNLRMADIDEANLEGADLGGADLEGAVLGYANLEGAEMKRANLRGADLIGAKLKEAAMIWADLRKADLGYANLKGADLGSAKLEGADLGYANLEGARLWQADLREADLLEAQLRGANLRYANFEGARLSKADLRGANLEKARNLSQGSLLSACGDPLTKLPDRFYILPCGPPHAKSHD